MFQSVLFMLPIEFEDHFLSRLGEQEEVLPKVTADLRLSTLISSAMISEDQR